MLKRKKTDTLRTKVISVSILLLVLVSSLFFLSNVGDEKFQLAHLGDSVQMIKAGETASYPIEVENSGPVEATAKLETIQVPQGWEASLSDSTLTLHAGELGLVFLSVTAPSSYSEEQVRTANVRVRATGNVTIGTITILDGSATLLRGGESSSLNNGDEIQSGDIVENEGESLIVLDPQKLINDSESYEGDIYILMSNAKIGFLRQDDTAYLTVMKGDVTISVPSGGGGGGRNAPGHPQIDLSASPLIDSQFPGQEYDAVIELGSFDQSSFFHLGLEENETTVELFEGSLDVRNDENTRTMEEFQEASAKRRGVIATKPVERTIITLESNGSVATNSITSGGEDVLAMPAVYHLPTAERQIFVTPKLPEITLDLQGNKDGEYAIEISQLENQTKKSFFIRTTASKDTTDNLIIEDRSLKLEEMEKDKTYDVVIVYTNTTSGEISEFEVKDVKTSDKDQELAVDDWEKLAKTEEETITFVQGDQRTTISNGTTGEQIVEQLDKEDEFPWGWLIAGILSLGLLIFGIGIHLGYLPIQVPPKKGLVVVKCETKPVISRQGEEAELVVALRNEGESLKGGEHSILLSIFDDFDPIDEVDVSGTDFEAECELELPGVKWTPEAAGERNIIIVIEIDTTESKEHSFTVQVEESSKPEEKSE